jgi:hypothetical protein
MRWEIFIWMVVMISVMNDHTNYDNKMIKLICSTYCYFNYKHYHKHKKLNYTKVNMIVLITSIINANININIHSNVHISWYIHTQTHTYIISSPWSIIILIIIIFLDVTLSWRSGFTLFCNSTSTVLSCPFQHAIWRGV